MIEIKENEIKNVFNEEVMREDEKEGNEKMEGREEWREIKIIKIDKEEEKENEDEVYEE